MNPQRDSISSPWSFRRQLQLLGELTSILQWAMRRIFSDSEIRRRSDCPTGIRALFFVACTRFLPSSSRRVSTCEYCGAWMRLMHGKLWPRNALVLPAVLKAPAGTSSWSAAHGVTVRSVCNVRAAAVTISRMNGCRWKPPHLKSARPRRSSVIMAVFVLVGD